VREGIPLRLPLDPETIHGLVVGDRVLLTGRLLVARDAAHRRMVEALRAGESLPFSLEGQVIYYMGPTPAPPGKPVGAAGPTTSGRMDPFLPELLGAGLVATIGKGPRSEAARTAMREHGAVYFVVTGGAGALLAAHVTAARVIAYDDLGPEAVREIEVRDLPAIVANDTRGRDLFEEGRRSFAASSE